MDPLQFGRQVQRRRKDMGVSQEELARQAGLSRNYISIIERGEATNVSMRIINSIALVLGTEPRELVDSNDQDPSLIPPALRQLALTDGLSYEIVDRLARIPRRGQEPKTMEAWRALFEAIRPYLSDPTADTAS